MSLSYHTCLHAYFDLELSKNTMPNPHHPITISSSRWPPNKGDLIIPQLPGSTHHDKKWSYSFLSKEYNYLQFKYDTLLKGYEGNLQDYTQGLSDLENIIYGFQKRFQERLGILAAAVPPTKRHNQHEQGSVQASPASSRDNNNIQAHPLPVNSRRHNRGQQAPPIPDYKGNQPNNNRGRKAPLLPPNIKRIDSGPGALETSQTLSQTPDKRSKNAGQLSRKAPMARETGRFLAGRRMDYESRPLSKEAELKWEKALREEEAATLADDAFFIQTTEDFFQRFPDPNTIQESMVSPPSYSAPERGNIKSNNAVGLNSSVSQEDDLLDVPRIPTRPAPALPRNSYSGISERTNLTTTTSSLGTLLSFRETDTISHTVSRRRHTGLTNFRGVTCYINAITQALNWTDLFSDYLMRFPTSPAMRVPRKKGEESDPPQLMAQNLGQVFRQLSNGRWENYTPDLFRVGNSPNTFEIFVLSTCRHTLTISIAKAQLQFKHLEGHVSRTLRSFSASFLRY